MLISDSTEPTPGDLNTVCGVDASKVQSQIQSLCGGNTSAALDAFKSVCAAAGKTVRTLFLFHDYFTLFGSHAPQQLLQI